MLAFKIYFNGKEFVADNVATEVQSVPCDSTVQWFRKQKFADDAVEKLNANHLKTLKHVNSVGSISIRQKMKDSGLSIEKMKAPCRCDSCRKKNRVSEKR